MTFNNDTLNFKRFLYLLTNNLRVQAKPIMMVAATLTLFLMLMPYHASGESAMYFQILYIGGFIVTSLAFKDLHDHSKAHLFLMLPCSNLERFLSRWLLTSVIYALGTLLLYYVYSLVSTVVLIQIFNKQSSTLPLIDSELWMGILKYIILQSVVLLGAISFKRFILIKTALVVGVFFTLLSLFSVLSGLVLLFPDYSQSKSLFELMFNGSHFIFWVILAPFCWYLTYLRLTEYELK